MSENDVRHNVFRDIDAERERQNQKWGGVQNLPAYTFLAVAAEEFGEAAQAALHDEFGGSHAGTLRTELVHLAAVLVQWIERIDIDAAASGAPATHKRIDTGPGSHHPRYRRHLEQKQEEQASAKLRGHLHESYGAAGPARVRLENMFNVETDQTLPPGILAVRGADGDTIYVRVYDTESEDTTP